MASYKIDRKQLMVELEAAIPILVKESTAILTQQYFDPAVAAMKEQFEEHPVTREIQKGIGANNDAGTLQGDFKAAPRGKKGKEEAAYSPPNLFSFIGFDAGSNPTIEIEQRLDTRHPDGPKLKYVSKDSDNLTFRYEVSAPDWAAIEKATPLPWAKGLSWAKRIEQGLPGVGHYLNKLMTGGSRGSGSASGGGIQVDRTLRQGSFRATKYLSDIFNKFLRKASSGRD